VPHGTKDTIALTVRLNPERYRRLVAYAAGFVPRKTHQDILGFFARSDEKVYFRFRVRDPRRKANFIAYIQQIPS